MRAGRPAGRGGVPGPPPPLTVPCPLSGTVPSANSTARPPSSCFCGACPMCSSCSSSASPSAASSGVTRSTTWWSSPSGERRALLPAVRAGGGGGREGHLLTG